MSKTALDQAVENYADLSCGINDPITKRAIEARHELATMRAQLDDYKRVSKVIEDAAIMLELPSWLDIPEAILATQQRLEAVEKQLATAISERDALERKLIAIEQHQEGHV